MIDTHQAFIDAYLSGQRVGQWYVTGMHINAKGAKEVIIDKVQTHNGITFMEWLSGDGLMIITVELRKAESEGLYMTESAWPNNPDNLPNALDILREERLL